jgi:HK97 family phage prohead protease
MQYLEAKATATQITDLGQFEALVSAWDADREKDVIDRTAFAETIRAWQTSGKSLPLLFEHSTTVVGSVDPHSIYASDEGLVVAGQVDRDTDEGKQAWRMIKAGSAGFSIGYVADSKARKGGGRTITEVDLLEISVTSKPMHPATRALGWKSQRPIRIASFEC